MIKITNIESLFESVLKILTACRLNNQRGDQLIQNFGKSAWTVTGGFVLQYGALNKENITFSDF